MQFHADLRLLWVERSLLERLTTERDLSFRLKMKYAPVVSVDIERSFSLTKKILTADRTNENLSIHYIIAFNSDKINNNSG